MSNDFDRLQRALRRGRQIEHLPEEQRRRVDALLGGSAPPSRGAGYSDNADGDGIADDAEIAAAARAGRKQSDVDAAARDGLVFPQAPRRSATTVANATRGWRGTLSKADAVFAEIGAAHRAMQRQRVRENTREILAKALAAFHAGKITADDVSRLEARAHRVMAMASGSSR